MHFVATKPRAARASSTRTAGPARALRAAAGAGALALVGTAAMPSAAEASLANQLGYRSGGTVTRGSTGTQQVTADPIDVLEGSISLRYDPTLVTLTGIVDANEFDVTAVYVGVTYDGNPRPNGQILLTGPQFFTGRDQLPYAVTETGYVQVFYRRTDGQFDTDMSDVPEPEDFVEIASGGETNGDETHGYRFQELTPPPPADSFSLSSSAAPLATSTVPTYTLYDDDGQFGQFPDYLLVDTDGTGSGQNTRAFDFEDTVLVVPEPSSGLAMLAAGAALLAGRRRRA